MSQNQQKSRDKPAVETPASDGGGASRVDVGKETKGKDDATEKARKKKKKIKGNGEDKGRKFEEDRGEDGDSGDGKLVDEVKKKKKMMMKKRTKEDSEDVENAKGGKRGVSEEGAKVNSRNDSMNKRHGDKNGDKEGSAVVSLTRSEGQRVEEDEARIVSKKQRVENKKDTEKEEDETDKVKLKSGEESGRSTREKQLNGDVNVRTDSKCSQSNTPIVVVLCLSRRDSPDKKTREKSEGNGKKLGEGRKRKSSGGEPEFDTARTSGLKKKRASGEKADEKDSKSCRLPLNRVRTIVRSDNSNIKITQESYFLICKATVFLTFTFLVKFHS